MKGKRVDANGEDDQWPFPKLKPGEYGKNLDGVWYCVPPAGSSPLPADCYLLGCLGDGSGEKGHKVTEHEDGTITVSPSIFISQGGGRGWHGFLQKGIWHTC